MKTFIHLLSGLDVTVAPDQTGGFFASVPALPGCGSQGDTVAETLLNLDDAIMVVLRVLSEDDPERLQNLVGGLTRYDESIGGVDTTGPLVTMVSQSIRNAVEYAA